MVDMMQGDTSSKLNEDQHHYLEIIKKSLHRMNKMINEILDVNVIESKVMQLKINKINLRNVIGEILDNHRLTMEQRSLELIEELEDVHADLNEVYILQVVDNLLSNAIKFTPSDKKIHIKVHKAGKKARIMIRDEGVGIPSGKLKQVFNMYQRKKSLLSQDEPDPGLGLAIVKKYVTAMSGTVWCESQEGEGATFFVEFPLSAN
jgi:signal transduction histidine kinase